MKGKRHKIDINDFNNKIVKKKMEDPMYVLNDIDRLFLDPPYNGKKKRKKK